MFDPPLESAADVAAKRLVRFIESAIDIQIARAILIRNVVPYIRHQRCLGEYCPKYLVLGLNRFRLHQLYVADTPRSYGPVGRPAPDPIHRPQQSEPGGMS